jgi:hypothetical protein
MSQIERSYFGRMERGQSQPTLNVVFKVAYALGYEASELLVLVEDALASLRS